MANKKLAGIKWPNMPNDTYWLDAEKVIYDETETYPDGSTGKALQHKAEIDGYYSEMSVGDAEQLISTVFTEDDTPYNFRTSGGSIDIGDREYVDAIVGGTVAWNQQVYNGDFSRGDIGWSNTSSWKSYSVSDGTLHLVSNANQTAVTFISTEVKNIVNHVYLLSLSIKSSKATEFSGAVGGVSGGGAFRTTPYSANVWTHIAGISKVHTFTYNTLYLRPKTTVDEEEVNIDLKNVMIIDLTQMFGSTIADYIYSLEQANTGAGVAWFKKYFPKPYYAYNAGELMSVNALRHDMVGFNQFDKSTAISGYYIDDANGQARTGSSCVATDFIGVIPNATYYIKTDASSDLWGAWYDADKNYISGITLYQNTTKTAPSNAHYARFTVAYAGSGNPDTFCINLSWDGERDGEYEPYEKHSYALDDTVTLRGIPKLSADNKLYYDGDTYESDGTVTRKYGVKVFDGTTGGWSEYQGTFYQAFTGYVKRASAKDVAISDKLTFVGENAGISMLIDAGRGTFGLRQDQDAIQIYPRDSTIDTAEKLNTWLASNPVTIVYELATPTEETATAYSEVQIVDDFGTEEFVDASVEAGTRDVAIPVGHNTRYAPNLRAKLEMAPDSPDGDGDYIVRQSNGENSYVPYTDGGRITALEAKLPSPPSTNGTYTLTVTVADGEATYSWEA